MLVLTYHHCDDFASYLRADRDLALMDIGIVGGNIVIVGDVISQAAGDQQQRHRHHETQPPEARAAMKVAA